MLQEDIVDLVPCRAEVLAFEHGAQVLHDREVDGVVEDVLDERGRLGVAGVDDGHAVVAAEPRLGLGRRDEFRDLDDVGGRAAVGAAGDQDHVRAQLADALDLVVRAALVVGGDDVHHDRPGPQRRAFGALGGHLPDHARHEHLQAAAGAGRGDIEVTAGVALGGLDDPAVGVDELPIGQLGDLGDRVDHADGHVGERLFDGGRRFSAVRLAVLPVDELDEDRLGRRAAAVRCENDLDGVRVDGGHWVFFSYSCSNCSMRRSRYSMAPRRSRKLAKCW